MRARLQRILAALAIGLGLASAAAYGWLSLSLARTEGEITLAGLEHEVTVARNVIGVPVIRAASDRDAYFALGFVHAQDRLAQMETMRRYATGRLAEVSGPAAVNSDKWMRTLGVGRLAEDSYRDASPALKSALSSYAAGVNAFLAAHTGPLTPALTVLRHDIEPWRPQDSLLWPRLMNLQLSGNWRDELMRAHLTTFLTPPQIAQLWPDYPADAPITLGSLDRQDAIGKQAKAILDALPPSLRQRRSASNSWVIDGARSTTGKPLLANDPHLPLGLPGTWYLARIETPGRVLAGATAPGVPFHILGRNGRIAWGLTTTHSDTQDLFVEKVDPDDPARYLAPDGSLPFETREEILAVRGQDPVRFTVRTTRHGPVISDIVPGFPEHTEYVFALQDAGLQLDDRTAEAVLALNDAGSEAEFTAALRDFHSPQQNFVYADVDGVIGFVAPARVPIRRAGIGLVPSRGWTGEYDWTGWIPYEKLPRRFNPESGEIVAANNRIVDDTYPYFLTRDWKAPFRSKRISDLLHATDRPDVEYMVSMQHDALSLGARALVPILLAQVRPAMVDPRALDMLRAWDGRMDRTRPEPLIFQAWIRDLVRRVYADELRDQFDRFWSPNYLVLANTIARNTEWCDDISSEFVETCAEMATLSLQAALRDIGAVYGPDPASWRWGDVHRVDFTDPILARLPIIGGYFRHTTETDGADDTINRGSTDFSDPAAPYRHVHGPGLRAVYDLGDLDRSLFMIVPGQSDNPLSPHYDDLIGAWRDGGYIALGPLDPAQARTLTLRPAGP